MDLCLPPRASPLCAGGQKRQAETGESGESSRRSGWDTAELDDAGYERIHLPKACAFHSFRPRGIAATSAPASWKRIQFLAGLFRGQGPEELESGYTLTIVLCIEADEAEGAARGSIDLEVSDHAPVDQVVVVLARVNDRPRAPVV